MAGCRELGLPAVARRWLTAALVGAAGQAHDRAQLVAAPSNSFCLPSFGPMPMSILFKWALALQHSACQYYSCGKPVVATWCNRLDFSVLANVSGQPVIRPVLPCRTGRSVCLYGPFGSTVWPSAVATAAVCKHCSLPFRFSAGPRRLWLSSGPARCCGRRRFVPATRLHADNIIMWKC